MNILPTLNGLPLAHRWGIQDFQQKLLNITYTSFYHQPDWDILLPTHKFASANKYHTSIHCLYGITLDAHHPPVAFVQQRGLAGPQCRPHSLSRQ